MALDEADVVLRAAVEVHETQLRLRPMNAIHALRVAHGPPVFRSRDLQCLCLEHAEIPHAKLAALLDHRAIQHGVSMIRRTLRPAPQHGVFRVLRRGHHRELQVVLPCDAVVIEGVEHALIGVGKRET